MMRQLGRFLDLVEEAVAAGVTPEALADLEIHRRILRLGEEIGEGEWAQFSATGDQLENAIAGLLEQEKDRRGDAREPEINRP